MATKSDSAENRNFKADATLDMVLYCLMEVTSEWQVNIKINALISIMMLQFFS